VIVNINKVQLDGAMMFMNNFNGFAMFGRT